MSTEEKPDTAQPEETAAEEKASDKVTEVQDAVAEGEAEHKDLDDTEQDASAAEIPELKQILEGAILAADTPLSIDNMMTLFLDAPRRADIRAALAEIEEDCEGRGFELKKVASGYRFQVRSRYGEWVGRLWEEKPPRYSRALLETLALIAYKQPITRGDIEEIRGVAVSSNIMRTLLEREWVRIVGHRDVPGRPALYATTKNFLDYFNLSSLDELPTLSEIRDLDKLNEELDLEEETFEPRSLELEPATEPDDDGLDDTTELDEVTDRVNQIQANIKNLFTEETQEDDFDDEDEDDRPKLTVVPTAETLTESADASEPERTDSPGADPEPATDVTSDPDTSISAGEDPGPAMDAGLDAETTNSAGEDPGPEQESSGDSDSTDSLGEDPGPGERPGSD